MSGRSLNDLDRIFNKAQIPVAGNHGAQLRDRIRKKDHTTNIKNIKQISFKISEFIGEEDNIEIENKGSNLTVHFRNSTCQRKIIKKTIINLIKHEPEFTLIHGKEVLEIKPISHDKGTAISYFMKTKPFFNRRPIFIGDDVSDEDGFETVNKKNGWSVRVGKHETTSAKYFLPNVSSVHEILNQLMYLR